MSYTAPDYSQVLHFGKGGKIEKDRFRGCNDYRVGSVWFLGRGGRWHVLLGSLLFLLGFVSLRLLGVGGLLVGTGGAAFFTWLFGLGLVFAAVRWLGIEHDLGVAKGHGGQVILRLPLDRAVLEGGIEKWKTADVILGSRRKNL